MSWTFVINDLNRERIVGTFHKKELHKANQKEFRIEKVMKKKGDELYAKWKGYNNLFNSWIDKKNMSKYFPKLKSSRANVKVELDLSNYTTKVELKNATGFGTSDFAKKTV